MAVALLLVTHSPAIHANSDPAAKASASLAGVLGAEITLAAFHAEPFNTDLTSSTSGADPQTHAQPVGYALQSAAMVTAAPAPAELETGMQSAAAAEVPLTSAFTLFGLALLGYLALVTRRTI